MEREGMVGSLEHKGWTKAATISDAHVTAHRVSAKHRSARCYSALKSWNSNNNSTGDEDVGRADRLRVYGDEFDALQLQNLPSGNYYK